MDFFDSVKDRVGESGRENGFFALVCGAVLLPVLFLFSPAVALFFFVIFTVPVSVYAVYRFTRSGWVYRRLVKQAKEIGDVETIGRTLASLTPDENAECDLRFNERFFFYSTDTNAGLCLMSDMKFIRIYRTQKTDSDGDWIAGYDYSLVIGRNRGLAFLVPMKSEPGANTVVNALSQYTNALIK